MQIRNWRFAIGDWRLALLALLLLAWALRLYRLSAQSLWYDEGYAVYVAGLRPAETLLWSSRDLVPPLHSVLLAFWLFLAGRTEFAARFLSAGMGVVSVAACVALGRRLFSRQAGLLAGLLAALSPFYVWYSQDARMYATQTALSLLATLCLLCALKKPGRWRCWIGLALLDAAALYTQTTSTFLLIFHALVILVAGLALPRHAPIRPFAHSPLIRGGLTLAAALALWSPWLIYALPFLGKNTGYWPGALDWRFVVSGAWQGFVTGSVMDGVLAAAAQWVWGVACLAGLLVLLLPGFDMEHVTLSEAKGLGSVVQRFFASLRMTRWKTALFLLAYFAVPVAAMAWLFHDVPKFSPRYLILASPPLFLLPAIGIASLQACKSGLQVGKAANLQTCRPADLLAAVALISLLATSALGLLNWYLNPAYAKPDFRTAARIVRERTTSDELVLLVPGHTFPVWQYYFGETGWVALPDDPILDVTHVLHYRNAVGRLNQALAGRSGVWLVEWDPRVVDPTDLVPYLLSQVSEEMPLPEQPVGLRLRHYRLLPDRLPLPSEPDVTPPESITLSLPLDLRGCVLPARVPGDQEMRLACYWEAQSALPLHLSVSARIVDAAGTEWGRADSAISGPDLVAGRWPLDEPVLGQYALTPIPGIPPGGFYQLQLLVYEPDGTAHGAATVTPLVIERPSRPFTATLSASWATPAQLGGLTLEAANVYPQAVLPGEDIWVEAIWQVAGPFEEPLLVVEGQPDEISLLPQPGATILWRPGDRYHTISRVPVSPYTPGGPTTLWAVSGGERIPVGAVQVDVTRTFNLPAGVQPLNYRLGDAIALAGAQVTIEAGKVADIVLYWRATAWVEKPYTVFVQWIGPDGQAHAQADSWPQAGRHPTTHWLPGEVVPDPYRLELSANTPAGRTRIIAGMYDLATMERLPVTDAAGNPVPDNAIPIGEFEAP